LPIENFYKQGRKARKSRKVQDSKVLMQYEVVGTDEKSGKSMVACPNCGEKKRQDKMPTHYTGRKCHKKE
jgi:hypothetical protein